MITFHYLLTSANSYQLITEDNRNQANDQLLRPHSETARFESIDRSQDIRVQLKGFGLGFEEYSMRDDRAHDV